MTATEKMPMAPHLDHFAKGYRLRANGSTPALTNRRMVKYRRARSKRLPDTAAFSP
jgi:hypothetical protein